MGKIALDVCLHYSEKINVFFMYFLGMNTFFRAKLCSLPSFFWSYRHIWICRYYVFHILFSLDYNLPVYRLFRVCNFRAVSYSLRTITFRT